MQRLKGKKIVIFGASGDIGGGFADIFHDEGAQLTLSGRDISKVIKRTKSWDTTQIRIISADASHPVEVQKVFQIALDSFGPIDLAMISTGKWRRVDIDTKFDEADQILDEHVQGFIRIPFNIAMLAQQIMRKQGHGLILNISSHAATRTDLPGNLTYTPGKTGGHSFLSALRNELKGKGVRVTNLAPMIVNTPGNAEYLDTLEKREAAVQIKDMAKWVIENFDNPDIPETQLFESSILVD